MKVTEFLLKTTALGISAGISIVGLLLAWLGFICPGLLWCSNFTNTESISLVVAYFVGCLGVSILSAGFVIFLVSFCLIDKAAGEV